MTEHAAPRNGLSTLAWVLGLAACLCNLMLLLLPIGLLLGCISFILGCIGSFRRRGSGAAGIVLSGVSFFIAAVIIGTIVSVFFIDPTLI